MSKLRRAGDAIQSRFFTKDNLKDCAWNHDSDRYIQSAMQAEASLAVAEREYRAKYGR